MKNFWERHDNLLSLFVAVLIVLAVVAIAVLLSVESEGQGWNAHTKRKSEPAHCTAFLHSIGILTSSDALQPKIDRIFDKDQIELCGQIRSTMSGEKSAEYAEYQFYLGVASLLAIALAALFAGIAANHAARQAQAAWAAIDLNKDTAHRQLRAYVHANPKSKHNENLEIDVSNPKYPVIISNLGQTPAKKVTFEGEMAIFDYPLKEPLPEIIRSRVRGVDVVEANGERLYIIHMDRIMNPDEVIAFSESEGRRMYIYGHVNYVDIFDKAQRTTFRLMSSRAGGRLHFTTCEEGNEAT